MKATLDRKNPYKVQVPGGKIKLLIMNADEGLPLAFGLMGTCAKKKVAIRITGGCKNMTTADKQGMLEFFVQGFAGFQGVVWSGATRAVIDGEVDPMVTDVPGLIAQNNPGCVALGTAPRTDILTLQGDSRLTFDQWNAPNPLMSGILVVQNGADGEFDWDGDVNAYFNLMKYWQKHAEFTALGLVSWNGGPVTDKEITKSLELGWPTILIRGSGRKTDEIIEKLEKEDKDLMAKVKKPENVVILDKDDPDSLNQTLCSFGFID